MKSLNKISNSDFINNYEEHKLMFERLFNNKNKFKLDNQFDKNNCQIFSKKLVLFLIVECQLKQF